MFETRTRLLFLACLKDAAGAALKNAAPAPSDDQQKSTPSPEPPLQSRLRNTALMPKCTYSMSKSVMLIRMNYYTNPDPGIRTDPDPRKKHRNPIFCQKVKKQNNLYLI